MTKPLDPYSRVYWRVLDDPKFEEVRSDMRHFGSWTLMLMLADMAYPAPAFVPSTVPKASFRKLVDSGLIADLSGGLYRVRGMKSERERRSPRGTDADPDGTPTGPAKVPSGTGPEPLARAIDETRRDETRGSQDEHVARAGLPYLDRVAIEVLERATGRPWSLAGEKQLSEFDRLVGDHGLMAVSAAFDAVRNGQTLTARQLVWPAMKVLEPMPSGQDKRAADIEDERSKRNARIAEQMHARRLEHYRFTGTWDKAWGPEPETVDAA